MTLPISGCPLGEPLDLCKTSEEAYKAMDDVMPGEAAIRMKSNGPYIDEKDSRIEVKNGVFNSWHLMDGYRVEQLLDEAKCICAPDEYNMRQRKLLHAIAEYVITRESAIYDS
jgi:hypothetical protein